MNSAAATTATHQPSRRYLCRHVHTDGRRCGSPALRAQNFCYYHDRTRLPRAPLAGRLGMFRMQPIDDRAAIQIALYDILSRLTAGDIDSKLARTALYGLQIASSNLAFRDKQQPTTQPIETLTTDPFAGDLAPIQEIPETNTQPAPIAEPAPTPVTSTKPALTPIVPTTPISQSEPATQSDEEEDVSLHSIPLAAIDPQPLTLAAVQACAAQFTPVKPALATSCNRAYKRYPQAKSRILSGLWLPYSQAASPRR